jgi:hypothetical protein
MGKIPVEYFEILDAIKDGDLKIICRNKEFNVHRSKMSCASLEIANHEGDELQLPEYSRDIVARVILFTYGLRDPFFDPLEHKDPSGPTTATKEGAPGTLTSQQSENSHRTEPPRTPQYFEGLKTRVRVYTLAAKLKMATIKSMAVEQFITRFTAVLSDERVVEPLRCLYESTDSKDFDLRVPVSAICVGQYNSLTPRARAVLKKHESWTKTIPTIRASFPETENDTIARDTTMAYIGGVGDAVGAESLKEALERYGELVYFTVGRERVCQWKQSCRSALSR